MHYRVIKKILGCVTCIAILTTLSPYVAHSQSGTDVYTTDPTITGVTASVFQQLNIPATGSRRITTTIAARIINRAVAQVCTDFPAYEKIDSAVIIDRDSVLGSKLPADYLRLKTVAKRRGDSLLIPMNLITPEALPTTYNTFELNVAPKKNIMGILNVYEEANRLRTHPKMLQAEPDTFVVAYWAMAPAAAAADSLVISSDYLEKVIMWSCSRLAALKQDYAGAEWYMTEYAKGAQK